MGIKLHTKLIVAGRDNKYTQGSINPIIQRASSLIFNSFEHKQLAFVNRACGELFYGRRGTLTHFSLQQAMIELENGVGCVLYPCGTAAIIHSILSFLSMGDHILVTGSVYEPVQEFCHTFLPKMNVNVTWFDPLIGSDIIDLIQTNTSIVFLESPGSMTMEIHDIPSIVKSVREKNDKIVIMLDNTWSAGLYFKALDFGIDISLQSATKYIIGHSDAMIGTAVANNRCWCKLREHSYLMGQVVDPDTAYMASRGLRTLHVRLKQHELSALKIAFWLDKHPKVYKVYHPALPSCKGHKYFLRDFSGSTGLFSFVLKKRLNNDQLSIYLNNFKCFRIAYSWGGFESLILTMQADELRLIRPVGGIDFTGTLVRLHVGLEDVDDLINDLDKGFSRIS